jgi:hypothetical protein
MTEGVRRSGSRAAALALWFSVLAVVVAAADLPGGWHKAGGNREEYEVGIDTVVRHSGKASAFLKATALELHGYGSLTQLASATSYRGKRIRFSGFVKTAKVQTGWAGLWLRVDGPIEGEILAFDNMERRPVKGTTQWTQYSIVLDVPVRATAFAFGLVLIGDGQVWMDDLKFEEVSSKVAVTGFVPLADPPPPNGPQNLDFEK